ncbi:MAG: hypothetical protein HOV87_15825 [Catenulispora sp.]|nr:hypothetical protein [Catenulispora sp.]
MTLMGKGAGETEHIEDLDWARDLFDGARADAEPLWSADAATITRAGDRRRRLRAAGTGGALLGVVAVTAAVAVTLGAGTTDYGSKPGPGGSWEHRKLQDVFRYAQVSGGGGDSPKQVNYFEHVPRAAAADVAALIGHLDPAGAHLKGSPAGPANPQPRIVGDGDSALKDTFSFMMSSTWTADGSYPDRMGTAAQARLAYRFLKADTSLGGEILADGTRVPRPCGLNVDPELRFRAPGSTSPLPQWSPCQYTELSDGSKIGTTQAGFGTGTETVAVRIFDTGAVVALIGFDYPMQHRSDQDAPPDPKTVLAPSPWSQAGFRAALADPDVVPAFPPMPAPNADGKLLDPVDLGPRWEFGTRVPMSTGEFVMDNGCKPDHSIFGLAPGRALQYTGPVTAAGGTPGSVFEGEYRLPPGTGPATMKDARTYAKGGCDPAPAFKFSDDTVTELPSGIGDDAFIENQPSQGRVRVNVRVGDTILEAIVLTPDPQRLDLTAPASRAWLEGIARQMAAHWTAAPSRTAGE